MRVCMRRQSEYDAGKGKGYDFNLSREKKENGE
jgi:hypothetical protein